MRILQTIAMVLVYVKQEMLSVSTLIMIDVTAKYHALNQGCLHSNRNPSASKMKRIRTTTMTRIKWVMFFPSMFLSSFTKYQASCWALQNKIKRILFRGS